MLNRLKELFSPKPEFDGDSDDQGSAAYLPREKILVFGISFILAFCLWFIVNLGRDFNITIQLPIQVTNIPDDMAFESEPPEVASVSILGEGWKLISLYNNPPTLIVDASQQNVNLFERAQQQVSVISDVSITQVQPLVLSLNLEEKSFREVPVVIRVDVTTRERYSLAGDPDIEPALVTISGAASKISEIDSVRTVPVELDNVTADIELELRIERPAPGVSVTPQGIIYRAEITEYTEGQVQVPIRIRNLPAGQAVTYNPTTLTVRYDVSIDQYNEVQESRPFIAYIDYSEIQSDTTGVVAPQIERMDDGFNVRIRSFQPRTVSYFNVVQEN